MKNKDYFKHKRVTVAGLARSGLACANLLYDLGAQVSVTDNQDNDSVRLNITKLKSRNIKTEVGRHTEEFIKGQDLIVVSPGVTDSALPVILAKQFKIPVISEIEVGWILCPATIIAVTGSSGKTTVTTLIGRILEARKKRIFICGNIGNPFCGEVEKIRAGDFVSLEVSSFQLEKIKEFKPKISVMLNLTYNHLDRHRNIEEYLAAKKRIFMNQGKSDYSVFNYDDPLVKKAAGESKAKVVFFSQTHELNPNQGAVLAVGSILGINRELCLKVLKEFKGIEHRLEQVTEINNVTFINDSKSTTAESCAWALKNVSGSVVLIAGGRDKGIDYSLILGLLRKKAKALILIGEAKDKIRRALGGFSAIQESPTLEEAVKAAFAKASPGDCVLFSPMCSSFDMFRDYEERGRIFKEAVFRLNEAITYGARSAT